MQAVNLMPPGYAQKERAKRRLVIAAAAMIAGILAMFGLARLLDRRVHHKEHLNALFAREAKQLQAARAELASCQVELQALAQKLTVIRTLDHNRRWASYVARIGEAANHHILLTRVRIQPVRPKADDSGSPDPRRASPRPPGPAAGAAEPKAKEADDAKPRKLVLLLEGLALTNTDVTRFISALTTTGAFERVTFRGSRTDAINEKPVSRFELECPIRYDPAPAASNEAQHAASPDTPPEPVLLTDAAPNDGGRP